MCVYPKAIYFRTYDDESESALVCNKHTPFYKVKTTELIADNEHPLPASALDLTATVKNEGIATLYATVENPVTVTFTMNGKTVGTTDITYPIPGGSTVNALFNVTLPEDISDVEFGAYVTEGEAVTTKVDVSADVSFKDSQIVRGFDEAVMYSGKLENVGNKAISNIVLTAKAGETEVGTITVDELDINEETDVNITLNIPDSAYEINEYGTGIADISITANSGEETVATYSGEVKKSFDAEAIAQLDKVTNITFESNGSYTMKPGDEKDIQPTISGADEGALRVEWLESTDTDIAYINSNNSVIACEEGNATITGLIVPANDNIVFDANGNSEKTDWSKLIPADKQVKVTVNIKVSDSRSGGSGGGGTTTYTVTFSSGDGTGADSVKVNRNGTVEELPTPTKDGFTFEGWFTDEALTKPFTEETKVTGNLKLYAKWTENVEEPGNSQTGDYVASFKDVLESDWFSAPVKYVYENNLFKGVTETEFAPHTSLTRAMLVTVLYRAENEPEIDAGTKFADVLSDAYYAAAVAWAEANGIVNGVSEDEFAPDAEITREQIAAIMYRYAVYKGIEKVSEQENLTFADAEDISEYAVSAMNWIVGQEIIQGYEDNTVRPQNNATRAETAAVLQRFLEKIKAMEIAEEN